jgi:hypothetical protein
MKPFERAHVPQSETDKLMEQYRAKPDYIRRWLGLSSDATAQDIEHAIQLAAKQVEAKEYWANDKYQVAIFEAEPLAGDEFPPMLHLSIKRHDRAPVFSWRDIQWIKNQLVGPENEAVQLFPAESRLVDGANQYHLWVLKDPTIRFPFGFQNRVVTDEPIGKSKNRPIE